MDNETRNLQEEVEALRQEIKNLAGQTDKAVARIQELEKERSKPEIPKPPKRVLSFQEEVQALRTEVKNLAQALNTAVDRIRQLEEEGSK